MSTGLGVISKASFKKDPKTSTYPKTDWGANDITALDQIPFVSESMIADHVIEQDPTIQGSAGRAKADIITKNVAGGLSLQGRYNNVGRLLCSAMGFENPNTGGATYGGSPETVSAKYKHLLELDNNLHREAWLGEAERHTSGTGTGVWYAGDKKVRSGVLAFAKAVTDWKYHSVMVNKMIIRGEVNSVSIEFDLVGYSHSRGSYNSANWTLASDKRDVILPGVLTTEISGTTVGINRFEIALDNQLQIVQDSVSGLYIMEPMRNGKRLITVGFDFVRYNADTYLDLLDADTEQYMSFVFADSTYNLGFYFSALKLEKIEAPIKGSEVLNMAHTAIPYIPSSDKYSAQWSNIELKKNAEMVCVITDDNQYNYLEEN
ncbi:MAG TPA: phage tail tube protein [Williamwhitmania sp.]|nr:phage tail tube protein [Williamwhitmania sp.]